MPWTAAEMAAKGAKRPAEAAKIANHVLTSCRARGGGPISRRTGKRVSCEALAIATALARTNK